jgi:MoxR-like ATPase
VEKAEEVKNDSVLAAIEAEVRGCMPYVKRIRQELHRFVVGQSGMVDRLLVGLFASGHILLEGAPGLAKTLAVRTLSDAAGLPFQRIQFTPDLLPADLVGTEVYNPKTGDFSIRKGPVFTNLLLADEINRAPPKVQSALLEAMQERQVTIGGETHTLPDPFLVLATQNPLEQEGTYPLPEAQSDRFMLKVLVGYPSYGEERQILLDPPKGTASVVASPEDLLRCRRAAAMVHVEPILVDYVLSIVRATRDPEEAGAKIGRYIDFGASPRAGLSLLQASRAHAFLRGRAYVTPDDVKELSTDVLRHRVLLTYEAEAEGIQPDWIVRQLLQHIRTP